ncbi:conserved hypothetical protein [Candidatus Desulfosporosinus infrequens]|uniref:Uncharacterized protein n=1 Tax=Candidatus Desulfosporosinus infrequens TaxID=2043169 RepID=A0A2U3KH14_9FIRM|nr:conserved hypothetical protein [Candidatus Desulfosporosinus infrequens]
MSDDELRPLSDTIENMDQIKSQLDQLQKEEQALKRLIRYYDQYNQKVIGEKAEGFWRTHQRLLQTTKALEHLHLEQENAKIALARQQETVTTLKREQQVLDVEREALGEHDVFKAEKERERLLKEQEKNQGILVNKTNQLTSHVSQEGQLKKQIGELELKEQLALATIQEELEELDSLAEESAFLNHEMAADEFNREIDRTFSFALWKKEALDYQRLLENVMKLLRQESGAREKYQEADLALSETKKAWDEEQYQEKKWADLLQEEQSSWVTQLFEWQPMNQELRFQDIELQTLALRARSFPESVNQSTLREPLLHATDRARDKIRREILNVEYKRDQGLIEVKAKSEAIEVWRQRQDPEPARHDLTNQARKILQDIQVRIPRTCSPSDTRTSGKCLKRNGHSRCFNPP